MRHDLKLRRVLRTKRQILNRYSFFGTLICGGLGLKFIYDERTNNTEGFFSSKISRLTEKELNEDPCN